MNGEWLIRGRDGRLSVYLVTQDAVLCRAEQVPGGAWDAPRRMGGDQRLHPGVAVGQGADSYAHLVAWRPTVPGEGWRELLRRLPASGLLPDDDELIARLTGPSPPPPGEANLRGGPGA